MTKIFECFSPKLYHYLALNGVRYERTYTHNKTGRRCWCYEVTDELSLYLTKWTNNERV